MEKRGWTGRRVRPGWQTDMKWDKSWHIDANDEMQRELRTFTKINYNYLVAIYPVITG